jgi:mannose-1-phosphate guanylyltransferase
MNSHRWAIVLAAGEGLRIRHFTSDEAGRPIPKQFWPIDGRRTMLDWSIDRAAGVVSRNRIVVIVANRHRRWWEGKLRRLPQENIVIQPEDRGTAMGILLPLLAILRRDPDATAVVLPSDHFVAREQVLRSAIDRAFRTVDADTTRPVLLGMAPGTDDPEYGWILPETRRGSPVAGRIRAFVEKPRADEVARLRQEGGLIHSFILAAKARRLHDFCTKCLPTFARPLAQVDPRPTTDDGTRTLAGAYDRLPCRAFSREVLAPHARDFSVIPVGDCGWSDLGTPARLVMFRRLQNGRTQPGRLAAESIPTCRAD